MNTDKLPSSLHPVTSTCFSNSPKDNPFHLDSRPSEVQQQANSKTRRLQIVQTLGLMDLVQFRHRFQFNQHVLLHQHVSNVFTHDHTSIPHGHRVLLNDLQPNLAQLEGERVLIHLLEEAVTQGVSDAVGGANDSFRHLRPKILALVRLALRGFNLASSRYLCASVSIRGSKPARSLAFAAEAV